MNSEPLGVPEAATPDDAANDLDAWPMLPIKFGYRVVNGGTPKSDVPEFWGGDVPWITPTDLSRRSAKYLSTTSRLITAEGLGACGASLVPAGSVVMSCRAPIGSLAVTGVRACSNQGCKSFVPGANSVSEYLDYVLTASVEQLQVLGSGTTFLEVSSEDMKNFRIPTPPPFTQVHVVQFLDAACARIDALITKQKQLIELLKEKRQAVISQAVTKGLDPDVPMKDSGVDWLGKVPEHWEVSALKWKAGGVTVGIVVEPSKYYVEDGVPCLRSLNVSENELVFERLVYISEESHALLAKSAVHEGDVVVVRTGQPGTAAAVASGVGNLNCIDLVIVRGSASVNPKYLSYQVNSDHCQSQIGHGSGGALQQHFNVAMAAELVLCFPPTEEQTQIVNHLHSACDRFELLIAKAISAIDLLTERRTALISAAVTGQIDVTTHDASRTEAASAT